MSNRASALAALNFGKVDAESEADLDQRFLRTQDFLDFASPDKWVAIGPKGTGKSALFELFAKHEAAARQLTPDGLAGILITTGTGFGDLSEVATGDISALKSESGYDHNRLWQLYIAIRATAAVANANIPLRNPAHALAAGIGATTDVRVLPVLKALWGLTIGDVPSEVTISAQAASITLKDGNNAVDVVTVLQRVHEALEKSEGTLWILFDKIDEIFPADPKERQAAIEGLFTASMWIRSRFPRIQPKVLIRTDIWQDLNFTNKSHLTDKRVQLAWDRDDLATLLLKRGCASPEVLAIVSAEVPELTAEGVEALTPSQVEAGIKALLPEKVYPGEKEADIVDWLLTRVTDAQGTVLPRETIMLGNAARAAQIAAGGPPDHGALCAREAVRDAFTEVSKERVAAYLSEFPDVADHVKRFRGQTTATFTRDELDELMQGLEPAGLPLRDRLYEIGLLAPLNGTTVTAEKFEVPRLYRVGLELVIRGRP